MRIDRGRIAYLLIGFPEAVITSAKDPGARAPLTLGIGPVRLDEAVNTHLETKSDRILGFLTLHSLLSLLNPRFTILNLGCRHRISLFE